MPSKRLQDAFDQRGQCRESRRSVGVISFQFGTVGTTLLSRILWTMMRNPSTSIGIQSASTKRRQGAFCTTFVRLMGVFFEIRSPNRTTAPWDIHAFSMRPFLEHAHFKLNGDTKQIRIRIDSQIIDQKDLEDANFTSMVDLVGNDVILSTSGAPSRCPGNDTWTSRHCEEFRRVLHEGVQLNEFIIRLPHRRDFVFDSLSRDLYREQRETNRSPTFSFAVCRKQ